MLLVETYLINSPGKGIGLYSKVHIKMNETYWIRNENFDRVFSDSQVLELLSLASKYIQNYGFQEITQNWYLCGDNARFTNHSYNPNTCHHFDTNGLLLYCTASKEIAIGEEILCDYTEICQTCKEGILFKALV